MNRNQAWELALLALCVFREARGESYLGKVAVAWSIKNRVMKPSWYGSSYSSVILHKKQYSSFNADDPNATKFPVESDVSWIESLEVCEQVYSGIVADPTGGSTHYHATSVAPPWAVDPTTVFKIEIGHHRFYIAQ